MVTVFKRPDDGGRECNGLITLLHAGGGVGYDKGRCLIDIKSDAYTLCSMLDKM